MALNSNQIGKLLVKEKSNSSLTSLMLEYADVKQKLDNADSQSWYFRQALQSAKQKLLLLSDEYESIRSFYNGVTIDCLLHDINENNIRISSYRMRRINSVQYMACVLLGYNNEFLMKLIGLKSKAKLLMPMDYYLQNPEVFLEIID